MADEKEEALVLARSKIEALALQIRRSGLLDASVQIEIREIAQRLALQADKAAADAAAVSTKLGRR